MGGMGAAESYEYSSRFKNLNDQDLLYIISFELGHHLSELWTLAEWHRTAITKQQDLC